MARGAIGLLGSRHRGSVTGVAGPEPDERGNPVGLVSAGAFTVKLNLEISAVPVFALRPLPKRSDR